MDSESQVGGLVQGFFQDGPEVPMGNVVESEMA